MPAGAAGSRAETAGPLLLRSPAANRGFALCQQQHTEMAKAGRAAGMEGCAQAPGVTASPSSWDTGCYGNEGCINTGHQSARIPRARKAGRRVNDSPRGQTLSHPSEESRDSLSSPRVPPARQPRVVPCHTAMFCHGPLEFMSPFVSSASPRFQLPGPMRTKRKAGMG